MRTESKFSKHLKNILRTVKTVEEQVMPAETDTTGECLTSEEFFRLMPRRGRTV